MVPAGGICVPLGTCSSIKSGAMTFSRSPQCRDFSRAVMDEKLYSPLLPIGGGAVVTNDWCIRSDEVRSSRASMPFSFLLHKK